jgi:maltose/moltooligosaccharide transporter
MTFYIGAVLLFLAVALTVFLGKEYDPETLAAYEAAEAKRRGVSQGDLAPLPPPPTADRFRSLGLTCLGIGAALIALFYFSGIDIKPIGNPATLAKLGCETPLDAAACSKSTRDWGLYVLGGGIMAFGLLQLVAGLSTKSGANKSMFGEIMEDMFRLPKTMRQLAVVQFFSWFAMFSMWIYLNDGVIRHHYGAPEPGSDTYQSAADWLGLLGGVYFAVAAIVAFLIPVLAKLTSRKMAHATCLLIGAFGFSSFIWLPGGEYLWISMIGVGVPVECPACQ